MSLTGKGNNEKRFHPWVVHQFELDDLKAPLTLPSPPRGEGFKSCFPLSLEGEGGVRVEQHFLSN